jgi:hypothetical protein
MSSCAELRLSDPFTRSGVLWKQSESCFELDDDLNDSSFQTFSVSGFESKIFDPEKKRTHFVKFLVLRSDFCKMESLTRIEHAIFG